MLGFLSKQFKYVSKIACPGKVQNYCFVMLSISLIKVSTILSFSSLATILPSLYNKLVFPAPPTIPKSTYLLSPGPLTAQPIIATCMGFFIFSVLFSISSTIFITSTWVLAHVGQLVTSTPSFLNPSDRKINFPTFTSSFGSSYKDTLIVSPIPSESNIPMPIEDFTDPGILLPASVTPKCRG